MKLELLLFREDFFSNFEKTLNIFSSSVASPVKVHTSTRFFTGSNYLVNTKLNIIFSRRASPASLRKLCVQYIYHPSIINRFLHLIYIYMSTSCLLRFVFSQYFLRIQNTIPFFSEYIFLPGNHSLKAVHLSFSYILVLQKAGFSSSFFFNSLYNRLPLISSQNNPFSTPLVSKIPSLSSLYVEQYVSGLPINRISEQKERSVYEKLAFSHMYCITISSYKECCSRFYLDDLNSRILNTISDLSVIYDSQFVLDLKSLLQLLYSRTFSCLPELPSVFLSLTHGDFQHANILASKVGDLPCSFLIDWELSDIRCCWYDFYVFHLFSRSPRDLNLRLHDFLDSDIIMDFDLKFTSLFSFLPRPFRLYFFLLEDLLLRLRNSNIPSPKTTDSGLILFVDELFLFLSP